MLPLQERLQIDVGEASRVRRRRSWSSSSSPQHLKAHTNEIDESLGLPDEEELNAIGSKAYGDLTGVSEVEEEEKEKGKANGLDEEDMLSRVEVATADEDYDSETLRDIDELLSPPENMHVAPRTPLRFDREVPKERRGDENVDILNLINLSRKQHSEKRRKILTRINTPESVSKKLSLRTQSEADIFASSNHERRTLNNRTWKPFGTREHPPRLSTLRKVVSSNRTSVRFHQSKMVSKSAMQSKDADIASDDEQEFLDSRTQITPSNQNDSIQGQRKRAPVQPQYRIPKGELLRWIALVVLWVIAIFNPEILPFVGERVSQDSQTESVPRMKFDDTSRKSPPFKSERNLVKEPLASGPVQTAFLYPAEDGSKVDGQEFKVGLHFANLSPETSRAHRNARVCLKLSGGDDNLHLGCVSAKKATVEVVLGGIRPGPGELVATLLTDTNKLSRTSRFLHIMGSTGSSSTSLIPRMELGKVSTANEDVSYSSNDPKTNEKCYTTCTRTCSLSWSEQSGSSDND